MFVNVHIRNVIQCVEKLLTIFKHIMDDWLYTFTKFQKPGRATIVPFYN